MWSIILSSMSLIHVRYIFPGDLNVGPGKFTVAAATGDTFVTGTLDVQLLGTFNNGLTVSGGR